MQYLPGFTVQCINQFCEARGHWLRADATGAAISDAPAAADFVSPADAAALELRQINTRATRISATTLRLTFDQAHFGHLFAAQTQVRNVGRS